MFGKKHRILYVTRHTLRVYDVSSRCESEVPWDIPSSRDALGKVASLLSGFSVHLVFGNDISYVFCLTFSSDTPQRADILSAVRALIPEDVRNENFDWRIGQTLPQSHKSIIQILCVPSHCLSALSDAIAAIHISVVTLDVLPLVLASETRSLSSPHIILFSSPDERLGLVAHNGAVYAVETLDEDIHQTVFRLRDSTQAQFGVHVQSIIVSSDMKDFDPAGFQETFSVSRQTFHPFTTVATKKSPHGVDKNVLEITLLRSSSVPPHSFHFSRRLIIGFVILGLIALLFFALFFFRTFL